MKELTKEQFKQEIIELNKEETVFDVNSTDSDGLGLSMNKCKVEINDNEIVIHKAYTFMEATIDFDIVEFISKEDSTYIIEFNNGLVDVEIDIVCQGNVEVNIVGSITRVLPIHIKIF